MTSNPPKRVLQVIHRMRPGGVQALVMGAYRHLDRAQVQFDFAVRSRGEEHHHPEIRDLGGRIFRLPWRKENPISPLLYRRALGRVLDEEGPFTAVHSHVGFYNGYVLPTAKKHRIPVRIAHSHNTISTDRYPLILDVWERWMRVRILRDATHLVACNRESAEWLYGSPGQNDPRVEVIHNAIDLSDFEVLSASPAQIRRDLGFPQEGPLLGHIGRFDPQKNHSFLIDIFAAWLERVPEAHLLLLGEGALRPEIQDLVEARGIAANVHFLGVRTDVPRVLAALDLFLLPSLYEGLPLVLIEAQAAGTPCLVSACISRESDAGLGLIHYERLDEDLDTWVDAIQRALAGPRLSWENCKKGLQRMEFDIQSAARRFLALYRLT